MGFDLNRGRVDRSTHPFTLMAGSDDTRLTIRVFEDNLSSGIFAALHEGGHGLYDQGFAPEDRNSLLGDAPSMGLHESQSRLWENHVGRSAEFWQCWFPKLRDHFPEMFRGWDANQFYRAVNVVVPGTNRVGADEATYHLHILLRYELESALLFGDLDVRSLPAAWNERSVQLLGVAPTTDREGCLQDVHWSLGNIGYFPTYTLGSLYAAQLAEAYSAQHPFSQELSYGKLSGLLSWLRKNVHVVGHRFPAEKIIRRATGSGLDSGAFFRHLERKHG
jgi:carboxypeptidase Taq